MKVTRRQIRKMLIEMMSLTKKPNKSEKMHMCMDGSQVEFGSEECVLDLQDRINDATHSRDSCDIRTDARQHYNGILNVLRRDLRSAKKENEARVIPVDM